MSGPSTPTQTHCIKMTTEQAAKISAEKTKIELQKLQQAIKNTNAFEKTYKNPSDIESDCSSDQSVVSDNYTRKHKKRHFTMEDRIYNDNQSLWKKNQELKTEQEKTNKQLRYLQFEYNNKCLEITSLSKKIEEFKCVKTAYFYSRINLLMCYFIILMTILQFKFDIPVVEGIHKFIELSKEKFYNYYVV